MIKYLKLIITYPTISLAALSAYLYICTYEYESSFLQEFNVSNNYLTLDLNTILKDATRIIGLGLGLIGISELLSMLTKSVIKRQTVFGYIAKWIVRLLILIAIMWSVFPLPSKQIIIIALVTSIALFLMKLVYVLIEMIKEKSAKKKGMPETEAKIDNKKESGTSENTVFIFSIFYPFIICNFCGTGEAFKQTKFQVIEDSTTYVVVRKYGDELICKDLKKNKIVGSKTVIYKVSTTKPMIVTEKELGQISISNEGFK